MKKHVRNVTGIKYGFAKLVVIFFIFNTRYDYVIPSDFGYATTST